MNASLFPGDISLLLRNVQFSFSFVRFFHVTFPRVFLLLGVSKEQQYGRRCAKEGTRWCVEESLKHHSCAFSTLSPTPLGFLTTFVRMYE
jgi:hypothetical protein